MSSAFDAALNPLRASLPRSVGFLLFWLILSGFNPGDLPAGVAAAAAATWASLRLLPPAAHWSFHPARLTKLTLRFLYQSLYAGIDVAWRALDPRLPVRPGIVIYRSRIPPGPMQSAFCTMTSLLPGTLPCGADGSGGILIHCLDVDQPVVRQLAVDEARLLQALGGGLGDS